MYFTCVSPLNFSQLTYMSIRAEIQDQIGLLIGDGRLFHLPLPVKGEQRVRSMFVSQEVYDDIQPPFGDNFDGIRHAEFRATLDSFVRGDFFTVSEEPYKKPGHTMLARVDPAQDEIWDIRCLEPNIRCFGIFAGQDNFIALTWEYRENLCSDIDWQREIERCKTRRTDFFGTIALFKGGSIDEYLSDNYRAV